MDRESLVQFAQQQEQHADFMELK
eukprot:gene26947-biopygen17522